MDPVDDDPYAEPELYDLEYAHHDEDVGWYVDRARAARGPVLELGCGTGRLTLPIARAGVSVLGVDRAQPMLDQLHAKLRREPADVRLRAKTLAADYLALDLDQRFAAVLWPFNAIHHCPGPDAVVAVLQRARAWLVPGGRLAMDAYLPDLDLYDRDPHGRYEPRTFTDPRSGERLDSWEQGWWDEPTRTHHVLYVYRHTDGREERAHLALRMYELHELHDLVARAGFRVVREAMDFEGTPLAPDALKWVALLA
jgi:SAM-dependent methyltransferase